jgi:hypothetical protein
VLIPLILCLYIPSICGRSYCQIRWWVLAPLERLLKLSCMLDKFLVQTSPNTFSCMSWYNNSNLFSKSCFCSFEQMSFCDGSCHTPLIFEIKINKCLPPPLKLKGQRSKKDSNNFEVFFCWVKPSVDPVSIFLLHTIAIKTRMVSTSSKDCT